MDLVIRSIIVGIAFGILGLTAHYAWKLMRSPSEGARRLRIALGGTMAVIMLSIMVSSMGIASTLIWMAGFGILYWVYSGFKKRA